MTLPPSEELPSGTMVGGYRVVRRLDGGGMGAVYEAVQPVIDKSVALKLIRAELVGVPGAVERFIQEARVVNWIRHPNIVDVFGFEHLADGRPVLVMELLQGETLRSTLQRRKRLDVAETVALLLPTIDALSAAHAAGVIHRDLKPENLFVVQLVGARTVKVLDFGIAKLFERRSREDVAMTSAWLGTPEYMSPEQCRNAALDGRSDLYSLGVILFELLVGRRPFDGTNPAELLYQHVQSPIPALPGEVGADATITELLRSLLAKQSDQRPASAGELAKALRTWQAGVALGKTVLVGPSKSDASTPVQAPAPQENRLCTLAYVAFPGLASLARQLAPEEFTELTERCSTAAASVLRRHGATVVRSGSDVIGIFGFPRSSPTDASRAVVAALEVVPTVAKRGRVRRNVAVASSVGIETGRVYAWANTDGTAPGVAGPALDTAVRLAAAAPAGKPTLGPTCVRHVAAVFELAPVDVGEAPETAGARAVLRVATASPARRDDEFFGRRTKMFGRAGELERLHDFVEAALRDHRSRFVLLRGAPGIGKTRVRDAIHATVDAGDTGAFVLRGTASGLDRDVPYALLGTMLRSRFLIEIGDGFDLVLAKLQNGVRAAADSDQAAVPHELDEGDSDLEIVARLLQAGSFEVLTSAGERVEDARNRVQWALSSLLGRLGRVAIFADGLEHADDATLDAFDDFVARRPDAALLIVGSARLEFAERRPHWGEGLDSHAIIELGPLGGRAIEEILRDLLSRASTPTGELVRRIADRSEGNPLVARETLRLLLEASQVDPYAESWVLEDARLETLGLPTTLHELGQARLDALTPSERLTLQRASVIGRTFWLSYLDQIVPREPHEPVLEALRRKGLVRMRERSSLSGDREFVFADTIAHDVAYDTLNRRAREQLHRFVAEWVAARPALVAQNPGMLALHQDRGGAPREAIRTYLRAGGRAASLGENENAIRYFERCCALADVATSSAPPPAGLGEPADFEELRVADWQDRVEMRLALGDTLRRVGRLTEAEDAYRAGEREILGVERRAGHVLDVASVHRYRGSVAFRLGLVAKVRGDFDHALSLYENAATHLGPQGDPRLRAPLAAAIAFAQLRLRRPTEALVTCKKGLEVCRLIATSEPDRADAASRLLLNIGAVFYQQGLFVRAERMYLQAGRVVDEHRFPILAASALINVAAARYGRGDRKSAKELFARAALIAERVGDRYLSATARNNLAEVLLSLGQPAAALAETKRSLHLALPLRAADLLPDVHRNHAEALSATGAHQEAFRALHDACLAAIHPIGRIYLDAVQTTFEHIVAAAGASGQALARRELGDVLDALEDANVPLAMLERLRRLLHGP